MKKKFLAKALSVVMAAALLTGCGGGGGNDKASSGGSSGDSGSDVITVGFSQVGAESDWRTANSESMKSTFSEANGYKLIFDDAQQKQENQITAIRNFFEFPHFFWFRHHQVPFLICLTGNRWHVRACFLK